MSQAITMMIQREISRYQSDLGSWARQVAAQRGPLEAFQRASHAPQPGQMARSMKHLASADRVRAERQIESHLGKLIEDLDPRDPNYLSIMRLAQGHWPNLYRTLDDRRRRSGTP